MTERRLFFLINQSQRKLLHYVDSETEHRVGISSVQAAALLAINVTQGSLLKEMGEALKLNNSAITGLTNRMEANQLIEKKPCSTDGRATRVFITEKGNKILKNVGPMLQELNTKLTESFSEKEVETIIRFLNHVIDIS